MSVLLREVGSPLSIADTGLASQAERCDAMLVIQLQICYTGPNISQPRISFTGTKPQLPLRAHHPLQQNATTPLVPLHSPQAQDRLHKLHPI